jgi:hypothetical protein
MNHENSIIMADVHILQIEIRSKKLSFILEFFKNISFIKKVEVIESSESQQEDFTIPQWHKDIVLSRRKTEKNKYKPLSTLDDEMGM